MQRHDASTLAPPPCLLCAESATLIVLPSEPWDPDRRFPTLCHDCLIRLGVILKALPTDTRSWRVDELLSAEAALDEIDGWLHQA